MLLRERNESHWRVHSGSPIRGMVLHLAHRDLPGQSCVAQGAVEEERRRDRASAGGALWEIKSRAETLHPAALRLSTFAPWGPLDTGRIAAKGVPILLVVTS
jgi:hypothetical protein